MRWLEKSNICSAKHLWLFNIPVVAQTYMTGRCISQCSSTIGTSNGGEKKLVPTPARKVESCVVYQNSSYGFLSNVTQRSWKCGSVYGAGSLTGFEKGPSQRYGRWRTLFFSVHSATCAFSQVLSRLGCRHLRQAFQRVVGWTHALA